MAKHSFPKFQGLDKWYNRFLSLYFPFDPCHVDDDAAMELKRSILLDKVKYLYQYNAPRYKEGILEHLESGVFNPTDPETFNDPFEYIATSERYEHQSMLTEVKFWVEQTCNDPAYRRGILEFAEFFITSMCEDTAKIMRPGLRIECFTTKNSNIPMWGHYADKHQGICIEYDLKHFNGLEALYPAIYTDEILNITNYLKPALLEIMKRFGAGTEEINKIDVDEIGNRLVNPRLGLLIALIKSKCWSYESEWRLIQFIDFPYFQYKAKISALYLGLKITSEIKDKILALGRKHYFDVHQMQVVPGKYAIKPILLEKNQ